MQEQKNLLHNMHSRQDIIEAVVLQTCNRLELYTYLEKDFADQDGLLSHIEQIKPHSTDIWNKYSRQANGVDLVQHLFEVAAGLDSQMIGENQILAQVKSAYSESVNCRMSKFVFNRLFHRAFHVGKKVRTNTNINCGAVSIALAAVQLARKQVDLANSCAMVIGAGQNAQLVAKYLLKMGVQRLILANRNVEKAQAAAYSFKADEVIALNEIAKKLKNADVVISSTASSKPILMAEAVECVLHERKKPLLIVDIAVPRDIDPEISRFGSVLLYNIDDLEKQISINKKIRSTEVPKARQIVAEFTCDFWKWYESLGVLPVVSELMQKALDLADREAQRYAKDFTEPDRDELKIFAQSLAKKLLHGPVSFLRNGSEEHQDSEHLQAAELVKKIFFPDDKCH